mmetsp:Transcript_82437/g.209548  ORF Transcript_82437/g.209548 Transcript_82437/m.209548 type:complete len:200 (-) Transcript_82437:407-1006(-)
MCWQPLRPARGAPGPLLGALGRCPAGRRGVCALSWKGWREDVGGALRRAASHQGEVLRPQLAPHHGRPEKVVGRAPRALRAVPQTLCRELGGLEGPLFGPRRRHPRRGLQPRGRVGSRQDDRSPDQRGPPCHLAGQIFQRRRADRLHWDDHQSSEPRQRGLPGLDAVPGSQLSGAVGEAARSAEGCCGRQRQGLLQEQW